MAWDILAAIGAATGVPALIWQVYAQIHTWRLSRPSLSVKAANGFPVYPGGGAGEHHFSVTATNVGGSPATVEAWGFRLPNGDNLILFQQLPFSTSLPALVAPQAAATFYVEGRDVLERCRERGYKARQLRPWVRTATGTTIFGGPLPWKD